MKQIDQIISALYLAKSDNREKMLSDLILNVLYNIGSAMPIDIILLYINDTFHLEPIKYEIQNCLDKLVEEEKISVDQDRYTILDNSKEEIHKSILSNVGVNEKRHFSFKQIVDEIKVENLEEDEKDLLWQAFNEYLLECFLVFGKKAINIFLPYKVEQLNGDHDIINTAIEKLKSEKLIKLFKQLAIEYPERLNEAELRYLTNLANRAEKFYSLGVPEKEYEKIKNLQIKDLIVIVDTNILYSILEIRKHNEDSAINEILRIAKEKTVDIRLVYIPRTYKELQKAKNYLEKVIPIENFKVAHMRSLINSEKLDPFAKKYYESKLVNSETPHPSQKIKYASEVLKNKSIIIYNNGFNELEENKEYIGKKIADYMDFEKYYNKLCDGKGYEHSLYKDDKKIEHDVFLREAIKILKTKYGIENEMKFVCLTLDRSLIHFDHYILQKVNGVQNRNMINPNFILPSVFIKKIRPFIPIVTENYRIAFISSITAPNCEKEDYEESLVVQKSMSFFKNLGIDDEEMIINCIKKELFLEEFVKHEKEHTTEDFIKSEIAIEIDRVKAEKEKLQSEIKSHLSESESAKNNSEKEKQLLKLSQQKLIKNHFEESNALKEIIKTKDDNINNLTERVKRLEKTQAENDFLFIFNKWELEKEDFIRNKWEDGKTKNKKSLFYALKILFISVLPIIIGIIFKANPLFIIFFKKIGIDQIYVWGFLTLVLFIEFFGRSYIFNKDRVKDGWNWIEVILSKSKYEKLESFLKGEYENEFCKSNPEPKNNEFLK